MCLVATCSGGKFKDVSQCGARVLQKFTKGRSHSHKEMIRSYLNVEDKETNSKQAAVLLKFFRTNPSPRSGSKKNGWSIQSVMKIIPGKNADDTTPSCQHTLLPLIPTLQIRGTLLPISHPLSIISYIKPSTLAFLRRNFPTQGYKPNMFVVVMVRQLLR